MELLPEGKASGNKKLTTKNLTVIFLGTIALFLMGISWLLVARPRVASITPPMNSQDILTTDEIRITFNKPIRRAGTTFLIEPQVIGQWEFSDPLLKTRWYRTVTFKPDTGFDNGTAYTVKADGLKSVLDPRDGQQIILNFTTIAALPESVPENQQTPQTPSRNQQKTSPPNTSVKPKTGTNTSPKTPSSSPNTPTETLVVLNVPVHFQQYPLSCEAAALKMALAHKGSSVSEDTIMNIIGIDDTPRVNNIWGDPNQVFVGSLTGKQNSTGYGVYWGPVAVAANRYQPSEAFSGWGISNLVQEIRNGNPVIIWGTFGNARPDSWTTPSGKTIEAWHGEHARVVIGFRGPADNPSEIILNDPVVGRVIWTPAQLLGNWGRFGNSGVVVR